MAGLPGVREAVRSRGVVDLHGAAAVRHVLYWAGGDATEDQVILVRLLKLVVF